MTTRTMRRVGELLRPPMAVWHQASGPKNNAAAVDIESTLSCFRYASDQPHPWEISLRDDP